MFLEKSKFMNEYIDEKSDKKIHKAIKRKFTESHASNIIINHFKKFIKKKMSLELRHLRVENKILTEELEQQDIWLQRAKRLIQLFQYNMQQDTYMNKKAGELLDYSFINST